MLTIDLTGKICLVSGAGRGIGKAIAQTLADCGAHIICISKNENSCRAISSELIAQRKSAEYLAVDVSNATEVNKACKTILVKHGAVDILINNAGITRDNLMLRMKHEEWEDVINTNLNSCFYFTQNLMHPMIKKRCGRIINISSVVGIVGNIGQANYAAAKAGLIGFTKSIARETATRGITANVIAPGFVKTDMTAKLDAKTVDAIISTIPMKVLGEPQDIANVVAFLCSNYSQYVTGQVLTVDGGMCM